MPESIRLTVIESRQYPLPADQLYTIVSDMRGHHPRIMPSHISTSSYRVSGGPDLDSMYIDMTTFEANTSRSYRLDITETEPGRAFRFIDSELDRWVEYRVRHVSLGESELTLVISEGVDQGLRFTISRYLKRQAFNRMAREVLENIERYRQTLGSRVITSSHLVTNTDTGERN